MVDAAISDLSSVISTAAGNRSRQFTARSLLRLMSVSWKQLRQQSQQKNPHQDAHFRYQRS